MTDETNTPAAPTVSPPPEPAPPQPEIKRSPGWAPATKAASGFILPKSFATEAELLYMPDIVPSIHITQLALLKILIMVSTIEMEVGWLGTAKREGDSIVVNDVFLFEQDVSYGHTELTTDSMAKIMQEVLQRPDGEEVFNNIRFWGHSHGSGGTDPSQQDNQTMRTFEKFGADFFLRGIFNRVGGASFSLFDWQNNLVFHTTPWKLVGKPVSNKVYRQLLVDLPREMQEKVTYTRPVYTPPVTQGKRWRPNPNPQQYPLWDPRRYGSWE